jgi:fumarate reductase flavoprotein subunit
MSDVSAHDVIVVGGGLAGLTVACRAAELGVNVTVLEAGPDAEYPCNTRISGAVFHIAHRSTDEPDELLIENLERATFGNGDPDLGRHLVDNAKRAIAWLESYGAEFEPIQLEGLPLRAAAPYNRDAELGKGPDILLHALTRALVERGARILLDHRVTDLVVDDGRVAGVRYRTGNESSEMRAGAVILADGGFQGNVELVRKYIGPAAEGIVQRNTKTGLGTAATLCEGVGARLVHMNSFYGHLLSVDALLNEGLALYPALDSLAVGGVLLDRHGTRFCDEGLGGIDMANKLARRADPYAVVVCDSETWERSYQSTAFQATPHPDLERLGGTVWRADTIAELAEMAGLPVSNVTATVDAFNEFADSQASADLLVARTAAPGSLSGVRTPPFIAAPVAPGITFTMGGPLIDCHSRVQSVAGGPIAGLYVAGSAAGGFDGGTDVGYAGGVIRAVVTGLAAAEHIAGSGT